MTGASDGLGLAITKALAAAGTRVVMACRNADKAERARQRFEPTVAAATTVEIVDLSSLDSVRLFAERIGEQHATIDLLINNAGIMATPPRLSVDGIEMQWATNHLGHFALTALLLDQLRATSTSRVVAVSSLAAAGRRLGRYDPTTLTGYSRSVAYANSKLANLVFALELSRRLEQAGGPTIALAAHPGVTHTNLASSITGSQLFTGMIRAMSRLTTQSVEAGAGPILAAAMSPNASGGQYYGPSGYRQYRGSATIVPIPDGGGDPEQAARLWQQSEELAGVAFSF